MVNFRAPYTPTYSDQIELIAFLTQWNNPSFYWKFYWGSRLSQTFLCFMFLACKQEHRWDVILRGITITAACPLVSWICVYSGWLICTDKLKKLHNKAPQSRSQFLVLKLNLILLHFFHLSHIHIFSPSLLGLVIDRSKSDFKSTKVFF